MSRFKIIGGTWLSEGWKHGDIVNIDEEAAKVPLQEGRIIRVPDNVFFREVFKNVKGIIANESIDFGNPEMVKILDSMANNLSPGRYKWDELKQQLPDILKQVGTPLVSDEERVEVIVLTIHNDRNELQECLSGLLLSSYPFKITIYENSLNSRNTAKIWNKLIKQSNCGYVMLIDSDAYPQNDILTPMMEVFKRHKNIAAVVPVGANSGVPSYQQFPLDKNGKEFLIENHASGYCMLFKKDIFDKIGTFDEDFLFYGQDSDWTERVSESEYRIWCTPRALVLHGKDAYASTSAQKLEKENKFSIQLDSSYASILWRLKALLRDKSRMKQI